MKKGISGIISILFITGIVLCVVGIIRMNKENTPSIVNVDTKIEVESVSLNTNEITLTISEEETIVATISPSDATDQSLTWISSNPDIVSVENGNIKGLQEGEVEITAKTSNGKTATCKVTVNKEIKEVEVKSIELNKTSINLKEGSKETLLATISPSDATDQLLTWTSSNTKIVRVNDGTIYGIREGEAEVTVKTSNGKSAKCKAKVTKEEIKVEKISLNKTNITLNVKGGETLVATISPENATDKSITWTSSNPKVVSVNNGIIYGIQEGETEITAKTSNGKEAKCKVIVNKETRIIEVDSISLNKTNISIEEEKSATIVATINPSDATDKRITWTSSNEKVVRVENGIIYGIQEGEAEITAKTSNGKSAKCKVVVKAKDIVPPLLSISIENYQEYGKSKEAKITISDEDRGLQAGSYKIKYGWGTTQVACSEMSESATITVTNGEKSKSTTVTISGKTGAGRIYVCTDTAIKDISGNTLDKGTVKWGTMNLDNSIPTVAFSPKEGTIKVGDTVKIKVQDLNGITKAQYVILDSNGKVIKDSGTTTEATYTMKFENAGTYYIGVKAEDKVGNAISTWKKSGKYTVNSATVAVEGITLDKTNETIDIGKTLQLSATINPSNATDKSVTWTSSNNNIATVSSSGLVTAKAKGEAEITAKSNNGKTAKCKITVNQPTINVENITLDKPSETLDVGKTLQLSATINPSNATDKSVTWTSSNNNIATVSSSGLVTAKAKGEAEITAKSNNGKTAKCKVIVNEQNITAPTISVATENYQEYGKSKTATITIKDTDGLKAGTYNIKYGWGTSTLSCSSLSKSVQIKVNDKATSGSTKVTISNETGAGRITVCNEKGISDVLGNTLSSGTVKWSIMKLDNKAPEAVLSPNGGTLNVGGTVKIIVNDLVGIKNAQYAILDSNGKTVKDSGTTTSETYIMKFESAGTYYIGVKAEDKLGNKTSNWIKSNKFTIDSKQVAVTGISLNKTSETLDVGKTLQLSATISPSNATNKTVTWTSSNTSVATVSANGLVTAKAKGEAEITAKTSNGKTAKCKVTVNQTTINVESITLNKTSGTLDVGKTLQLSATINPSNATNKTVTWTSSNTSVATVSSSGLVTAKAKGEAEITAKSNNGKTSKCKVTVIENTTVANQYQRGVYSKNGVEIRFGVIGETNLFEPNKNFTYYFKIKNGQVLNDVLVKNSIVSKTEGLGVSQVDSAWDNKKILIPDNDEHIYTGTFNVSKNGVYTIKINIGSINFSFDIGIIPKNPIAKTSNFYYGVSSYLFRIYSYSESYRVKNQDKSKSVNSILKTAAYMGINIVRDGYGWPDIVKNYNDVSYNTGILNYQNQIIQNAQKNGMKILWTMGAKRSDVEYYQSAYLPYYKQFVENMAKRYASNNNIIWEIWNEPDNKEFWGLGGSTNGVANYKSKYGTMNQYLDYLKAASAAIKGVNSKALVSAGGLSVYYNYNDFLGIRAWKGENIFGEYKKLLNDGTIDYYAIHNHRRLAASSDEFLSSMKDFENNIAKYGMKESDKNILVTESGNHEDSEQAFSVADKALWYRSHGYKMFLQFSMLDYDSSTVSNWDKAIFGRYLEPRDAAITYSTVINMLGQADHKSVIKHDDTNGKIYADIYYNKTTNQSIIPVFCIANSGSRISIPSGAKVYDMYGNIKNASGSIIATKNPIYIVVNGNATNSQFSIS